MEDKQHILTDLQDVFTHWQVLLAGLSEDQINSPLVPSSWTVKDVVAHLWSWQQASVARAEAALHHRSPDYPEWWKINGPDPEEDVDRTNAWLYDANRDKPWPKVYADWKTQFQRFIELTRQIPEEDLVEPGGFSWMGGYALAASSMGSLGHHQEHAETLTRWLQEHAQRPA